ncbi:nuclear transport factor 2 family protein [Kovacikia minuta CCNUW1]|uniref:nuclear transport factor 2 family protein n=1 Tax=Kovacikia minuta TaxID=2931930 RepID=UPI001CCDD535|nr:nuclear transport factor 2 family protein [Kovacikia minuta]UBF29106.1 nuclear transport factor 2 family protein [Kovacikia minuta CCNUW1]
MRKSLNRPSQSAQHSILLHQAKPRHWKPFLITLGLVTTLGAVLHSGVVRAQKAEAVPPPELTNAISQIDTAASSHNVQSVLEYYSPNFTQSDGLTRQTLGQALTELWKRYPDLKYQTAIKSWKPEGKGISAETETRITGTQKVGNREWKIDSTLRSRQLFEDQKIVRQEVLAEKSQITSGKNPPTVLLNAPEQVKPGQQFNFDAIVQEPLGNDLLLGTALEEPVKPDGFINPTTADLEVLSAGGIYKVGRAPTTPENRWLSAVLVRQDGMTLVTQRVNVVGEKK